MKKKKIGLEPPSPLRRLFCVRTDVFRVRRADQTNKQDKINPVDPQQTAANCRRSVRASETNPHKLIVEKSSHLTRRSRWLAVERSTNTEIFTSSISVEASLASKIDFSFFKTKDKKRGNISLILITTTPTAAGTVHGLALLYLNGNFLTRFHAHPANRNYRPAHKTPPNQSKSPLHVGTIMWVMKLANGLSAKFLDSVDLVELRRF